MGVERSIVRRIALLWIALCLGSPLGAGAETAAADDDAGSGAETAAPADAGKAAGEPAKPAPVGKKEALAELSDLPPPDPDAKVEAYPGIIHQVVNNAIVVRRAGRTSDPTAPAFMAFTGKLGVPVEGQGKNSWLALRKGDVVMVSYVKGPPHQTTEVAVLADGKAKAKAVARIPEVVSHQPRQRSFIGYDKKKEGDELIVMSPNSPPPGRRPAEVKAFVRTEAALLVPFVATRLFETSSSLYRQLLRPFFAVIRLSLTSPGDFFTLRGGSIEAPERIRRCASPPSSPPVMPPPVSPENLLPTSTASR
jgi:hypothetical protein